MYSRFNVKQFCQRKIRYLYVYENACPAAVSFVKGEDNTVSASGTFIINDGFDTSSPESLQEFFGETGAVVENVPIT